MAPEIVVFPNAVPLVVSYLDAHLPADVRVSAAVPPNSDIKPLLPLVQIVPQGGSFLIRKQVDQVVLAINIYHHAEKLAAIDGLALQVRAVVESMEGQAFGSAAVTRTREIASISRLPDADPQIIRVGLTVSLLVRPLL